jgi:murein L,D-transpeptidase YafK
MRKALFGLAALLMGSAWHYDALAQNPKVMSHSAYTKQGYAVQKPIIRAIVVHKPSFSLHLFEWHDDWVHAKSYSVSLGKNFGRKQREGDNRTPEGTYTIEDKLSTAHDSHQSSYLKKLNSLSYNGQGYIGKDAFGPFAFLLDYPNQDDRKTGRTGRGIMIHSVSYDKVGRMATHGCIGLRRDDMESLYRLVGVGTKVYIRSR